LGPPDGCRLGCSKRLLSAERFFYPSRPGQVPKDAFRSREADMMGGARVYPYYGRRIAGTNGVGFDNHSFFVVRASKKQLAGAVLAVANCSQQATATVAQSLAKSRKNDAAEDLLERLLRIFRPEQVQPRGEIYGASDTPYEFTAIVRNRCHYRSTLLPRLGGVAAWRSS
jgi:hypothetical protein